MRVRLYLDLDLDGEHAFRWEPSTAEGAVDVPEATLLRWSKDYAKYLEAKKRWRDTVREVDELLHTHEARGKRETTHQRWFVPGGQATRTRRFRNTYSQERESQVESNDTVVTADIGSGKDHY